MIHSFAGAPGPRAGTDFYTWCSQRKVPLFLSERTNEREICTFCNKYLPCKSAVNFFLSPNVCRRTDPIICWLRSLKSRNDNTCFKVLAAKRCKKRERKWRERSADLSVESVGSAEKVRESFCFLQLVFTYYLVAIDLIANFLILAYLNFRQKI